MIQSVAASGARVAARKTRQQAIAKTIHGLLFCCRTFCNEIGPASARHCVPEAGFPALLKISISRPRLMLASSSHRTPILRLLRAYIQPNINGFVRGKPGPRDIQMIQAPSLLLLPRSGAMRMSERCAYALPKTSPPTDRS